MKGTLNNVLGVLHLSLYLLLSFLLGLPWMHFPVMSTLANFLSVKTVYVLLDSTMLDFTAPLQALGVSCMLAWILYALIFQSPLIALSVALLVELLLFDHYFQSCQVVLGRMLWLVSLVNLNYVPIATVCWMAESQASSVIFAAVGRKASLVSSIPGVSNVLNKAVLAGSQLRDIWCRLGV